MLTFLQNDIESQHHPSGELAPVPGIVTPYSTINYNNPSTDIFPSGVPTPLRVPTGTHVIVPGPDQVLAHDPLRQGEVVHRGTRGMMWLRQKWRRFVLWSIVASCAAWALGNFAIGLWRAFNKHDDKENSEKALESINGAVSMFPAITSLFMLGLQAPY